MEVFHYGFLVGSLWCPILASFRAAGMHDASRQKREAVTDTLALAVQVVLFVAMAAACIHALALGL